MEIFIVLLVISSIKYNTSSVTCADISPQLLYCTVLYFFAIKKLAYLFIYAFLFDVFPYFFFTFSFLLHARIITTICSIEKCGVFGSWFILYINANNFLYIFFVFFGWHWSSFTFCTVYVNILQQILGLVPM